MRPLLLPSLLTLSLLLVACGGGSTIPSENESSSSSSSAQSVVETHNVSFTGTVRPSGISIYMEGTHRLELGDGRFILLSSETADLNGYVGESVEVTGSIRPTVEEGGTIMRVEQIRLLESSSVSSSSSVSPVASAASSASSVAAASSAVPPVSSVASAKSSLPSSPASSAASVAVDVSAQIATMAKQDFSAANWTQAYCAPTTISFCVPVHRNWYFKSFGAATEALWHVEVGSVAIENVTDGAIAVNLLGGSLASKGRTDNEVRVEGSMVRGYREWTKERHIEIIAPAALESAVTYMTQHLSGMEE